MDCDSKCGYGVCSCLLVILSAIVGAIIGILFHLGYIIWIAEVIGIIFNLAIFILGFLLLCSIISGVVKCNPLSKCLYNNSKCMLAGSVGTIILGIVAFANVLAIQSIFAIVVVSLSGFFFTLMLLGIIGLINCVLTDNCR